jgi:catechol 2,3-dioxygenase-like lactoylglutathione lyase family enzyme
MSTVASKLNISKVGRVCVTVADTDRALDFYVGTLGFEKVVDEPMGPGQRWVEVAVSGAETGIILDTSDVDGAHAALKEAGADVDDEVTRFGGAVPPMFWLRDPDGNSLIIVQPSI